MSFDRHSPTWYAISTRLAERRKSLVEECVSVATVADRRAELAARIAEIDGLLDMPNEMVRLGQMAEPAPTHTGSY